MGATVTNQRERILDTALTLMAEHGAGATSMRQLARACDLNVAAIYHYFPSKAELLRSVIEERQYTLRLQAPPPVDPTLPARDRLVALVLALWEGAQAEEPIWRLLVGESLRGEPCALAVGRELLDTVESALRAWLSDLYGDPDPPTVPLDTLVPVVLNQLVPSFLTQLYWPGAEGQARARQQADAVANLAFGWLSGADRPGRELS